MTTVVFTDTTTVPVSWICPAGVNTVQVQCWGGGARGGGAFSQTNNVLVVPGGSYFVFVGKASSPTGQSSLFEKDGASVYCLARGGRITTGGPAAIGVGDIKYSGGNPAIGGGGGGGAGSTGDGGDATGATGGTGTPLYGGNGGDSSVAGSDYGGGGGVSASGAPGMVILTYTTPVNIVQNVITKKVT